MKKLYAGSWVAVAVMLLVAGCKDAVDLGFSPCMGTLLTIQEQDSTRTSIRKDTLIDAKNDKDFNDNINKLLSVDIDRVTYGIARQSGPVGQQLRNAYVAYALVGSTQIDTLAKVADIDLTDLANEYILQQVPEDKKLALARAFREPPHAVRMIFGGRVNRGPVDMDVRLRVCLKVKAKAN